MTDTCPVVILAGGFGTRLAERTDEMPKPMVEVGGRPVLWHILKIYGHYGFTNFLVACGYRSEVIKRFFLEYRDRRSDLLIDYRRDTVERLHAAVEPWRVGLIDTGAKSSTGGRLKRLTAWLAGGPFMMTYGDGVSNIRIPELLEFHRDHGRLATFTVVSPPSRFGRPRLEGDRCIEFVEKPRGETEWINGGYFVLEPEVLDWIEGDETSLEQETLPRLAAAGELMAWRHEGFWHPMDTLRDVRELNQLWREGDAPWKVWEDATTGPITTVETKPAAPCPPRSVASSSPAAKGTSDRSCARGSGAPVSTSSPSTPDGSSTPG